MGAATAPPVAPAATGVERLVPPHVSHANRPSRNARHNETRILSSFARSGRGAAPRAQPPAGARATEASSGSALCRCGDTPLHWYGTLEGLLKWSITSSDGRSVTFGGLSVGCWFGEGTLLRAAPRGDDAH